MELNSINRSCPYCIHYTAIPAGQTNYIGTLEKSIHEGNPDDFVNTVIDAIDNNYTFSFTTHTSTSSVHDNMLFIGSDIQMSVRNHGAFVANAIQHLDSMGYNQLTTMFMEDMGAKWYIVDEKSFCYNLRMATRNWDVDNSLAAMETAKQEGYSIQFLPSEKSPSVVNTENKTIYFHKDTIDTFIARKDWLTEKIIPAMTAGGFIQPSPQEWEKILQQ